MGKIFSEILSMSVDSAWLIIAVIVVRAVLQKAPMYFRKVLWGLVGLRLFIPFSFESALSLVPHKAPQAADRVTEQVVNTTVEQGLSFTDIISVLWISVGVAFLIYGIFSYIKLRLRLVDGVLVKDNIYQSDRIQSPFVCGFVKPRIYLPYGLDESILNCVLQHERTHIKYADHIIKAFGFVALCIHWFNPLVWISYFLLCKDIELSCDESVIKKFNENECKQYAKALLELGVNRVKLSACPIAFGEVSIKTRIKSVINYKKASRFLVGMAFFLCVVVAVCFMTKPQVQATTEIEEKSVEEVSTEPTTTDVIAETETEVEKEEAENQVETTQPKVNQVVNAVKQKQDKPSKNNETTVQQYDDSMFENEEDGLFGNSLNGFNSNVQDGSRVLLPIVTDAITQDDVDDESSHSPNNVEWGEYGTNSRIE